MVSSSSSSSSSSEVKIVSECFIKPKTVALKSKEPYHLSPTDHVVLSFQYIQKGLLFLKQSDYDGATKPKDFMETLLQKLKDSLAATLVHFYPFAGRLSTLKTDNPRRSYSVFVDCNNSPGAGFIHAKLDLCVSDIIESTYVPLVVHFLFDHHKAVNLDGQNMSLLSVKVHFQVQDLTFILVCQTLFGICVGNRTCRWSVHRIVYESFDWRWMYFLAFLQLFLRHLH